MSRKGQNIFGTSFLDLLSGALGAVIILFIIVPKMTATEVELLNKVKVIETIADDVDDLIDRLKNSVPKELLEQIEEELNDLKTNVHRLQEEIAEIKRTVETMTTENATLKEQVAKQQEEIERLRVQLSEATKQIEDEKENNRTANTVEKTLGVFAKFGILCRWSETNADVDIGVQRFGSDPEHCWRMYPSKKWGILGEDVRERNFDEEERFELFYVPEIHPDIYTAWINIYDGSRGKQANVLCTLIFHPGKSDEQRYEVGPVSLTGSHLKCFVTFRLNDSGFEILQHKEPFWGEGRVVK